MDTETSIYCLDSYFFLLFPYYNDRYGIIYNIMEEHYGNTL